MSRITRALTVELVEVAVAWAEERPIRELVDEIVLEGWRKFETEKILRMILGADGEVQTRVEKYILDKRAEEESMLLTLRLEEMRQKRLARIAILKEMMSKKLNAQKVRDILKMMQRMTMEDLEMEIEEVEAKAMDRGRIRYLIHGDWQAGHQHRRGAHSGCIHVNHQSTL